MISVLITNPKGGCGKTTVATHLAAAFATTGQETLLAETDPQGSSISWLEARPPGVAHVEGANWVKEPGKISKRISRVVIDSAAGTRLGTLRDLIRLADIIVVPILPSAFDQNSTKAFLDKLRELKPIRKNRKPFALVRNRVRRGSRAASRLDDFMMEMDTAEVGRLQDRALYNEVAWQGLTIFDLAGRQAVEMQQDWIPLIRFIESES